MTTAPQHGRGGAEHVGLGVLVGAGVGLAAGALEMAVLGAVGGDSAGDALFGAVLLGVFGAMYGALYGACAGVVLGLATLPMRHRADLLRRLRLVWAAVAALVVVALSTLLFGPPSTSPGPNETTAHVVEDLLTLYLVPVALAGVAAAWVVPRTLTPPRR